MERLTYKNEINFLRAISVIAVIFYHSDIKYLSSIFKGGHLGVDIFFFISGYLISKIIFFQLYKNNFSFKSFYIRRIRRILPILFLVIFITIVLSYNLLLPLTLKDFSQSVFAITLFVSNILFWKESVSYADTANGFKPLLHTWSLSVEEQFYIVAPLFFYIIFFKKKNFLLHTIIFFTITSYFSNVILSKTYSNFNFFWIFGRIWEFSLGSLIAYLNIFKKYNLKRLDKFNIFPVIGLIIILFSIFYFDFKKYPSPNIFTLIPIFGSILIITFYEKKSFYGFIFENKFIILTGLISYSLYLWHYPIFAFIKIMDLNYNKLVNLYSLVIIYLISFLSWKYVENPFRDKNFISDKALFKILFLPIVIFLNFGYFGHLTSGYQSRFENNFFFPIKKGDLFFNTSCNQRDLKNICASKKNDTNKFVILYGDSIAEHLSKPIYEETVKNKLNFKMLTGSGCFGIPGVEIKDKDRGIICNDIKNYIDYILKQEDQIIILSARFSYYLSGKGFDNKEGGLETRSTIWLPNKKDYKEENSTIYLKNFIEKLASKNKVILIYPIPEVGWHVGQKLYNKSTSTFTNWKTQGLNTSHEVFLERNKKIYEIFDSINSNNLIKIYPEKLFCNNQIEKRCITHDNKEIFYVDGSHLSYYGGKKVSEIIFKNIK